MIQENTKKKKDTALVKMILDAIPSVLFFIVYFKFGIYKATGVLVISIVITTIVTIKVTGKFSPYGFFIALIALVGGGLTLYLKDETFIKMKVTVIETFMALVLLGGYVRKKYFIQSIFSLMGDFTESEARKLTRSASIVLLCIAGCNELIWRNFSTDTWIMFKTFGIPICTMLFIILNIKTMLKAGERKEANKELGSANPKELANSKELADPKSAKTQETDSTETNKKGDNTSAHESVSSGSVGPRNPWDVDSEESDNNS